MHPIRYPRASRDPYSSYSPEETGYHEPLRPRRSRGSPRPYLEDEYHDDALSYPPPERRRTAKQLFFDEAISQLIEALKDRERVLVPFKQSFEGDISRIKSYANDQVIDSLWMMKIDMKPKKGRKTSTTDDPYGDRDHYQSDRGPDGKKFKDACRRLGEALHSASDAKASISKDHADVQGAKDKAAIERTLSKLRTIGVECAKLLKRSRGQYTHFGALLDELKFVDTIVEYWTVFRDGNNEAEEHDDGEGMEGNEYDDYGRGEEY